MIGTMYDSAVIDLFSMVEIHTPSVKWLQ